MTPSSERLEFEAWLDKEMPSLRTNITTWGDEQVSIHAASIAWATWQARAALSTQPLQATDKEDAQ